MKVLMFGWEFPPLNSGGLGVACEGLAKALAKKGTQITFVLPRKAEITNDYLNFAFADDDSSIKYVPVKSRLVNPYHTSFLNGYNEGDNVYDDLPDKVLEYEFNAANIALREDFDVIHAHDWLCFGAGIKAKEASGKPLIVHVHATEFDRSGGNGINQFVYEQERNGFVHADRIITVSELTKNIVVEKYHIDPNKIAVVHNGVDLNDINHEEVDKMDALNKIKEAGYNLVLYVGRLTIQKNVGMILSAAKDVISYLPKTIFIFTGSGDMERELIEKSVELGISSNVIFTGFVRGSSKHRLYKMADVFIMPSISEPFGIVPLESLANGTPAIVSKQSGVAEILSHSLKVDFWDLDDITEKLIAVLSHGPLRETLAVNGKREVETITWERAAEKVQEVYHKVKI